MRFQPARQFFQQLIDHHKKRRYAFQLRAGIALSFVDEHLVIAAVQRLLELFARCIRAEELADL